MKTRFQSERCITREQSENHRAHAKALGLPYIEPADFHDTRLAIVGGGSTVVDHIQTLKDWSGDIWAVNGAYKWCRSHGIKPWYVSFDPMPVVGLMKVDPGTPTLLVDDADPSVYENLRHADIRLVPEGIGPGPTTTTVCTVVAPKLGYRHITFFGCNSDFNGGRYAYQDTHDWPDRVILQTGPYSWITTPGLLCQADLISTCIRNFRNLFHEKSGGLLAALVEYGDYQVVDVKYKESTC